MLYLSRSGGADGRPPKARGDKLCPATPTIPRPIPRTPSSPKGFDILMGDQVAPRKEFIQTHTRSVRNLEL